VNWAKATDTAEDKQETHQEMINQNVTFFIYDDIVHVLQNTKKRKEKQTVKQYKIVHDKVHVAFGKHKISTAVQGFCCK